MLADDTSTFSRIAEHMYFVINNSTYDDWDRCVINEVLINK